MQAGRCTRQLALTVVVRQEYLLSRRTTDLFIAANVSPSLKKITNGFIRVIHRFDIGKTEALKSLSFFAPILENEYSACYNLSA